MLDTGVGCRSHRQTKRKGHVSPTVKVVLMIAVPESCSQHAEDQKNISAGEGRNIGHDAKSFLGGWADIDGGTSRNRDARWNWMTGVKAWQVQQNGAPGRLSAI